MLSLICIWARFSSFFLRLVRFSVSRAVPPQFQRYCDRPILRSFCFYVCNPVRTNIWMNLFQFILVVRRLEMLQRLTHAMSSNVCSYESYLCEGIRWSTSVCYSLAFHCSCSVSIVDRMRLQAYSMWVCVCVWRWSWWRRRHQCRIFNELKVWIPFPFAKAMPRCRCRHTLRSKHPHIQTQAQAQKLLSTILCVPDWLTSRVHVYNRDNFAQE